jgi:hypothetical protein
MTDTVRVIVETGPKGKKVAAYAPDWPGLTRGDKTEEAVLERLVTYIPRYAPVVALAGLDAEYGSPTGFEVVHRLTGTGSTDFWGISFAKSDFDKQPMSSDELERDLSLLQASWKYFDAVRARVSPEMQKGPRGGGRDRDKIVRHVFGAQLDWERQLGMSTPIETLYTDDGLRDHRETYCNRIREIHAGARQPRRNWTARFMIRFTAYHTLDHAWEMEDKDLTGKSV